MAKDRSFTEYIADAFYNELFAAVRQYVFANRARLDLRSYIVTDITYASLSDISVKAVGVDDCPGSRVACDVILEAEIEVSGAGKRGRESDLCVQWFSLHCSGDLSNGLSDFKVHSTEPYDQKKFHEHPLSDALVPILYATQLEDAATDFLRKYYPEALDRPMPLDTVELTKRMGLKIVMQRITEDFSVFGQIFFAEADSEVYDAEAGALVNCHFDAGTIVVDPQAYLLRNLGCVNNTIVHECVHWDRHSKAFELERLYNASATQIKCIVVGGIKKETSRSANEWMEWQATSLAPRIQMPVKPFKEKARELIVKYKQLLNTYELVDVMEHVIDELAVFFCVSRHAAKIRMVDVGYEEAVGAFTFIDGRYVKPHAFKKGSLAKNQTYSIGYQDAIVQTMINMNLREAALSGDYVYVDAHVCLNHPKYVTRNKEGSPTLTEYGRLHVDECCLTFDLKLVHANKYGEQFYKECVLYRDVNSGLFFEAQFAKGSSTSVTEKAAKLSEVNKEIIALRKTLPMTFSDSLIRIMEWAEVTEEELAEESRLNPKTIQRLRTNPDYNVTLKTVVSICIGLHLHPLLSMHLINAAGLSFRAGSEEHMMYQFFITGFYTHPIDECNEMLEASGFKILSGKE